MQIHFEDFILRSPPSTQRSTRVGPGLRARDLHTQGLRWNLFDYRGAVVCVRCTIVLLRIILIILQFRRRFISFINKIKQSRWLVLEAEVKADYYKD